MTRLFILLYAGVLTVLFLAWYIHGAVLKQRAAADRARVFEEAHGGGARLVAGELDAAPRDDRDQVLQTLRGRFAYPLEVILLADLPKSVHQQISDAGDVAYFHPEGEREVVVAALSNGTEAVRLGPFPDYQLQSIEESIGGWMRLAATRLESISPEERQVALDKIQQQFKFPIDVARQPDVPAQTRRQFKSGKDVVFFMQGDDRWFAATPLPGGSEVFRCGPFPSFEQIEQKAATTMVALVLLLAAIAIALLLRPIARQLRHVENAAKSIAAGDLSARVDERRVRSAKPLAQAFNQMASRTESLVRTQREMLQAVSHELRTPLSRMRFAIDLIETAKDEKERHQRLESLDAATEELDELVGELLSYVRMETAEPQLNCEHIALQEALDVLIPKHSALYPSIHFYVNGNAVDEPNTILADRTGFYRAIGNLLSNAGRFAKSQVLINAESHNGLITVDVDDDGSGIPKSERARIFEPFVRLDDSSNGHGAGLGLALVKRIVAQHGGSIDVSTSLLGGCRMRTTWPGEVRTDSILNEHTARNVG
ncbi:MAG: hypothetical protein CMJ64_19560 [Planctomycetaceae bacterium]|nr:hypothetical protein [Planctomycetaceae bacterium]